jgi:hypothetical protein
MYRCIDTLLQHIFVYRNNSYGRINFPFCLSPVTCRRKGNRGKLHLCCCIPPGKRSWCLLCSRFGLEYLKNKCHIHFIVVYCNIRVAIIIAAAAFFFLSALNEHQGSLSSQDLGECICKNTYFLLAYILSLPLHSWTNVRIPVFYVSSVHFPGTTFTSVGDVSMLEGFMAYK